MLKKLTLILYLITSQLYCLELEKPKVYNSQEINGWVMSEKLDGIRAYWNTKELVTKNGKKINTPKDFTKNFPPFEIDGELWTKRNDFENIQSIVLDKKPSNKWNKITYNIFEAPNSKGDFIQRIQKVKNWFKNNENKNIRVIEQMLCRDKNHLDEFLENIVALKGEGVIIKNPNLAYVNKRSKNSLKVKKFYDMEGVVTAVNYNNKVMKSMKLILPNGMSFNLGGGFSQNERLNPPKIGSSITFKYYALSKNGKPKFASFLRVREIE